MYRAQTALSRFNQEQCLVNPSVASSHGYRRESWADYGLHYSSWVFLCHLISRIYGSEQREDHKRYNRCVRVRFVRRDGLHTYCTLRWARDYFPFPYATAMYPNALWVIQPIH